MPEPSTSPVPAPEFQALVRQGHEHALQGRTVESLDAFQRALELDPRAIVALLGVAQGLMQLSRFELALQFLEQALALQPDLAPAWFSRSLCLRELQQSSSALQCWNQAVRLQPDNADAWLLRGITLMDLRSHDDAVASLDAALRLRPEHAETWSQRGLALAELHRHDEALQCFTRVLQLREGVAGDWLNQGVAFNDLARPGEAITALQQALALEPGYADAWCNIGLSHTRLQALDEAIQCFERALTLQPDLSMATWNMSLVQLQQGNWGPGWKNLEARWLSVLQDAQRHKPMPRLTSLEQARGKRVLVWAEQGLGDTLQFFRYVPLLEAICGSVVLEADAALVPLLSRHLQGQVCSRFEGQADLQVPLLSLPGLFGTTPETVPPPLPCLRADSRAVTRWQPKLASPPPTGRPRIALACSGNPGHGNDARRSCALREFAPLFDRADIHLVQKQLRADDAEVMAQHPGIRFWGDQMQDFEDTAAIISEMDLVISVDTSLVHLAGAMHRPVWVLLPYAADWRWMSVRTDSPWYSSARLFRQTSAGAWRDVIQQVCDVLTEAG